MEFKYKNKKLALLINMKCKCFTGKKGYQALRDIAEELSINSLKNKKKIWKNQKSRIDE